jgi:hypothetical protein
MDVTKYTYIRGLPGTEIMARELLKEEKFCGFIDYQIRLKQE